MAAPSFKSRGGGSIGTAARGGRNGAAGGSTLGANSRWSSGPPRQLNPNTSVNSNTTAAPNNNSNARAAAVPPPNANDQQQQQQQQQQPTPSRASPAAHAPTSSQTPSSAFPTLGAAQGENTQAKMHERIVFLLASLVGSMVVVTARGGAKYVGLLSAASTEQGELGISLASAQQIVPGASADVEPELGPAKGAVIVLGRDLDEIEAYDVKFGDPLKETRSTAERDSFRTDTDISKTQFDALGGGRVLQKWSDDPGMDVAEAARAASMGLNGNPRNSTNSFGGLEEAPGPGKSGAGGAWDQFAVNERQFGVKSNYDEDIYTTKLDRSGKDFRERERNAERLAREILNATSNNPHLAEERNQATEGAAGADEEAKYGAVLRGPNAYVPPAARRAGGVGALSAGLKPTSPLATHSAAAAAKPTAAATPATAIPPPVASGSGGIKPPTVVLQASSKDHTPELAPKKIAPGDVSKEFSKFVSSERERMHAKRQQIQMQVQKVQKEEMKNELQALKSWHVNFQLKAPLPENLESPLRNKNKADVSDKPRDPNLQKSLSPNVTHADAPGPGAHVSLAGATAEANGSRLPPFNRNTANASSSSGMRRPPGSKIQIAAIPPFDPEKFKSRQAASKPGVPGSSSGGPTSASSSAAAKPTATAAAPASNSTGAKAENAALSSAKLSAKASSFKPNFNPNATAFTPGAPAKKTETPAPAGPAAATTAPPPANPFFGNRVLKRPPSHTPLHVREEFNPFKVSKVPEAVSISPEWRFTGKNYRQLFTAVPPPATQVPVPMAPHVEENFVMPPPHSMQQPQPGMVPMVPGAHPPHGPPPAMQHHPGPQVPHSGPPTHGGGPPQQMGMPFPGQPHFYPRFPQQPQHFPQQMPMPAGQGIPYGTMPPQFVGQMQFSPPMAPHGAHPVYSPQMANMPPPGQHGQFVPQQGPMQPMPGGPHGPGGGPPRGGPGGPPLHMQKGPPQMYFQQSGPVHAMPYGHPSHFIPGGPGGRPGMPPMDGSYPGVGGPQMGDPGNHM
ncbi:unnamed protein product [Tilletia controversa]|uniref:LsmAD domain-containing protein n=3 Tax=Tilletia TaxID=13289 RepID=A0A8X7N055_9BASI|nr:hypothetical protein CF336_g450 [Tilletia laevis]KAE8205583.1 hypothetical protein CF328_g415 [Tilletia controversa]KAE8265467.1 hypothetical protein A4X03_0g248 [Tilletia caries]KAE8208753.1 hypothetical protein CF335_g180 [Tilletia laevis]KAE8255271.1 hypothetical protein A4X06_0g511 [Tilletia controversa]